MLVSGGLVVFDNIKYDELVTYLVSNISKLKEPKLDESIIKDLLVEGEYQALFKSDNKKLSPALSTLNKNEKYYKVHTTDKDIYTDFLALSVLLKNDKPSVKITTAPISVKTPTPLNVYKNGRIDLSRTIYDLYKSNKVDANDKLEQIMEKVNELNKVVQDKIYR